MTTTNAPERRSQHSSRTADELEPKKVGRLREAGIAGIAGNYDSTVGTDYKHCGCKYEDPLQEALSHLSFEWTKGHTSIEVKEALAALPFRIDLKPLGGYLAGPTVVLVHGTPTLNTVYWTEDRRAGYVLLEIGHGVPTVEFVRVPYDLEQTTRAIRESELPDDFADYLATGGKPAPVASD